MHIIVDSMHRDAMAAYAGGDAALAQDVVDRDQDVDRLYWMTMKQHTLIQKDRGLADRLGVDIHDSLSLMLAARILERVGDHAEKIAQQAIATAGEPKTETVTGDMHALSERAVVVMARAIESLFLHDISAANPAIDEAESLAREGEELFPKLTGHGGKGTMSRTAVMDSILRTIMYSTDIAEIAINDAMRLGPASSK
jgi:phosphate uptake regulator